MKGLFFISLLLMGCSNLSFDTPQKLNPAIFYKNDICFEYESDEKEKIRDNEEDTFGFPTYSYRNKKVKVCGVGVLPYREKVKLKVDAFNKIDKFVLTTCHRDIDTDEPDKGIFKKNGIVKVNYKPTVEKGRACPIYVAAFNRKGKHAWGTLAMENPAFKLQATLYCNGQVGKYNGVAICQSREDLIQKIVFEEPVKIIKPVDGPAERKESCPELKTSSSERVVEFRLPTRECLYGFIGKKSLKAFKLYTVGYEQLIVR